jgi:GATA-binding protein 2
MFPYNPSPYASHQDSQPSNVRSQGAYHHAMAHARSRSNQEIMNSMFTPVLPDISSPPGTTSTASHERVSWERSGLQGNIPSPLSGLGSDSGSDSFQWSPNSDTHFMNFDAQIWNDALSSPMTAANMHSYLGYKITPEISPISSPGPHSGGISPYPDVKRQASPASSSSSSRPESRRGSVDSSGGGKSCSHCHATSTPLWRREPTTLKPLCNACGLYLQQRNKHRPQELIDADAAADDSSEESEGDGTGPECSHCRTHHTSVWRRSKTGAQLCNACGVYSRLRGRDRPLSLKRNRIKPRSKHTPTPK